MDNNEVIEMTKMINGKITIDPNKDFNRWLDERRRLVDELLTNEQVRELIILDLESFKTTGRPFLEK